MRWSKTDLSKETKNNLKKRCCTNFRSSHLAVFCKKGVLKNFATCFISYHQNRHSVAGNNLSKPVRIIISEFLFLTLLLFFCRSSNKNMLELFLLIISKECTPTRSTNLLSRNHPTMFLIKKRCPILIANFMIRSTESAVRRSSSKQVFLKILQYSQESTCVGVSF